MSTQAAESVVAKRIVGIAGSLRAGSFSRRLVAAMANDLPADMTLQVWGGLEDVPPFNEDLEDGPAPVAVAELRRVIKDADGVLCHARVQRLDPGPTQKRPGLGVPATRCRSAGGQAGGNP
jgi:hypothetical protein